MSQADYITSAIMALLKLALVLVLVCVGIISGARS